MNKKMKQVVILSLVGITTLSLAGCGSKTTETNTSKTATISQKQTNKPITKLFGVKTVKSKDGTIEPDYNKLKENYKKELGDLYVYLGTYTFKKANHYFQNGTYFNIMYNGKTHYKVYFNKNGDVTGLKQVVYIPLTKIQYIQKIKNSPSFKRYTVYKAFLEGKQNSLNGKTLEVNQIKQEISLLVKRIETKTKNKKEIANQIKQYLNSQIYMLNSRLQDLKYKEKIEDIKLPSKNYVDVLKYIRKQELKNIKTSK